MRAAVVTTPEAAPVCADFPDPEQQPGREPLRLVGAGLHHVVRAPAAGRHYGSDHGYPLVPGIDAVARTDDGRLVYTGLPRPPWGTMAERLVTPFHVDLPAATDPLAVAAGMNAATSGWMPLAARREETGELGTVLVLGATGLAGTLAVRAASFLGAKQVIAAGRDREALERLRGFGAVTVRLAHAASDTWSASLGAAVADAQPTLVLDFVWGSVAEAAFAALGGSGADDVEPVDYVQIGSLAGAEASRPAALLRSQRIRISGSGAGSTSKCATDRRTSRDHRPVRRRHLRRALHRLPAQSHRRGVGASGPHSGRRRPGPTGPRSELPCRSLSRSRSMFSVSSAGRWIFGSSCDAPARWRS